jgi:hypothetical protein
LLRRPGTRAALLGAATAALIAVLPASGAGAATGITVDVDAPKKAKLLDKLTIKGTVANPVPTDEVTVTVTASSRELFVKKLSPSADGSFSLPLVVDACCGYVISASAGGFTANDGFQVQVPKKLRKGPETSLYNQSLQAQGYHTGTKGARVTEGTRLATKAFRKVNGMGRSEAYKPAVFKTLLQDGGAFKPQYDDGRHVEVDISRQVMSLIEGDVPVHTFHISSGAGGTPTIRGNFRFYMKQAGYNAKRMYFSVYFHGGYATHGYNPVPNYPASHGCVRNPIPFSRFIYNWIEIGMPIHVYG